MNISFQTKLKLVRHIIRDWNVSKGNYAGKIKELESEIAKCDTN